jgi:hypothetical protein
LVSDLDSWPERVGTTDRAIRTDRAVATSNLWIALSAPSALSDLSASFIRHPWIRFSIEEIGKKIDQHENETKKEIRSVESFGASTAPRAVVSLAEYARAPRIGKIGQAGPPLRVGSRARRKLAPTWPVGLARASWNFSLDRRWNV